MIDYLIGVDGGGTGTRARLARPDGTLLAQADAGPSGLALGIPQAWAAVCGAIADAFVRARLPAADPSRCAIGLGLAGVHNRQWAAQFAAADPGFASLLLQSDAYTTLLGAHAGQSGVIVAIGTGSVAMALLPDGGLREVGGWGFPSGDEASGAWIGLRAMNYFEQVIDGRRPASPFAQALGVACGEERAAVQQWLGQANQTAFASLAPIVVSHGQSDPEAHAILAQAGLEVARMAQALDPAGTLPLALCGGLGAPLRGYLPSGLSARAIAPQGDSASGALRMIARQLHSPTP